MFILVGSFSHYNRPAREQVVVFRLELGRPEITEVTTDYVALAAETYGVLLLLLHNFTKYRMISAVGNVRLLPGTTIENVTAMFGHVWWSVHLSRC